ncbi:MAG: M14 family metallopeptidase [Myxococcota bacterium]
MFGWGAIAAAAEPSEWVERLDATGLPAPADRYHSMGAGFGEVLHAARAHPAAASFESIGTTVKGRPIWAVHVQDPARDPVRSVLVFAGIHALEWISSETAFQFAVDLIVAPPPGVRVTVIPVLNVDGRHRTEADVRAGRDVYRRGNGAGVDLNRDFAENREAVAVWRHLIPGYYHTSPGPLSQPESRALDALADRERYDRAASLHAFGGYLYAPWAGRWERPPDWPELLALGRAMEEAQGRGAYRPKQLSRWGFFFRAHGAEIDHLYGRYGTRAFLIELTRSGIEPLDPLRTARTYFRWYGPADPRPHVERGVAALRALVTTPDP